MSTPTIKIEGTDALLAKFERFKPAVKAAVKAVGTMVLGALQNAYPPEPEVSRYRRTMKLQKSWNMRESGEAGVIIGSSTDAVPYNRFVMDREQQTATHEAHGWPTVQSVAEEWQSKATEQIQDAIEAAVG